MKIIIALILSAAITTPILAAEKKSSKKSTASAETTKKKETPSDKPSKSEVEAKSLTPSQKTKLMSIVNEGDTKALTSLPGVGEGRAAAIKKARPLKEPLDLLKIEGIGEGTFSDIVKYAKAGFPSSEPKTEAKKESVGKSKSGRTKSKAS